MIIRKGFISNSSSSSFIAVGYKITEENQKTLFKNIREKYIKDSIFIEYSDNINEISEIDEIEIVRDIINNCDLKDDRFEIKDDGDKEILLCNVLCISDEGGIDELNINECIKDIDETKKLFKNILSEEEFKNVKIYTGFNNC